MAETKDKFLFHLTTEDFEKMVEKVIEKKVKEWEKTGNEKEFLSYKEACKLLDIKEITLYGRIKKGFYKKYINGGKLYVKTAEVMAEFKELT